MKRRDFLSSASAVAASCLTYDLLRAQSGAQDAAASIPGTLTIDESATFATIPQDFIGLSYESAQLANPAFFSAENTALIALFRELSDQGVLRLGGGTSEFTVFTTEEPPAAAPFDAVGPDTSKNVKSDTPITPKSLRNLRAFLDATGWRCLYGLNLGRGPVVDEAALIAALQNRRLLGASLDVFEQEPLSERSPLWGMENVLISPHCTDWTEQPAAQELTVRCFIENFHRYQKGEPLENVVNKRAGY